MRYVGRPFRGPIAGMPCQMPRQMKRSLFFPRPYAVSGLAAAWLALAATGAPAGAEPPKVVVTIKPVHALVAGVMDGVAVPLLLVDGSASPHTFTLKPSAARAIHSADVFFRVSEALEPFTAKIAEALPASVRLVSLVDAPGMKLHDKRQGGAFEAHQHQEHNEHEAGETHDGKDGHIWLDPENAKAIVRDAAQALSAADAGHAGLYAANAVRVLAQIDALSSALATELAPVAGKPFIVFHDAYQYFEKRFDLTAAGSVTVSPDVQPSAKRLSALRQKISELGAVCVFAEPVFQPNLVAAVTEGTKARAGTLDPEGMMLEAGPGLYVTLMQKLAQSFRDCLGAGT